MGRQRRGRRLDPGVRDRHQRRPGHDGRLQDRHRPSTRLPARHLPARVLRRPRCAQGRDDPADGDASADAARLPRDRRHDQRQPHRLRQLGRVGVAGRCRRSPSRASTSPGPIREDATTATPATSCSSSATTTAAPTSCSRPPTRPGRRTTATAATASTPTPGHAHKVSYNRPFTTRGDPDRGLAVQRRVPDDPLAGAQRLRRQLLHATSTRTATAPRSSSTRSSCPSGTTSTGRPGSATNVEAARDAGVNLAFFSGNEIYWKTRWEPSTADGGSTDYRTLVSLQGRRRARAAEHYDCAGNFDCDPDPDDVDRPLAAERAGPRRRTARERAERPDQLGRHDDRHPGPGRRHGPSLLAQHRDVAAPRR